MMGLPSSIASRLGKIPWVADLAQWTTDVRDSLFDHEERIVDLEDGGGGSGDVVGPGSSVADRVVTFDGTTGKLIKDSGTLLAALAPKASPTFTGTPAAPTAAQGTNTTQVATTAMVQSEVALLAPKASPAFTGNPTAPTASPGDNDTTIATTAFVAAAVSSGSVADGDKGDIVVSSSGATWTIDTGAVTAAKVAADVATQAELDAVAAAKAPLASPALTGNPTAPTQTAGNNSTRIATTAYADGAASTAAGGLVVDSIADADTTHAPSRNSVFDALALKAPLASPTLTGTPAAPTAAQGTNTTQVATTAMVQSEVTLLAPKASPTFTGTAPVIPDAAGATQAMNRQTSDARYEKLRSPGTVTSSATPTINTDTTDFFDITALATAITSMTTNLSGTPANGDTLTARIKDNGTSRAITWGSKFEACGADLPTATTINKRTTVGFRYDTATSKWGCVASITEA